MFSVKLCLVFCCLALVAEGARKLRVVTIESPPFMYKDDKGRPRGYLNEFLMYLQEQMGIRYKIHFVKDGGYGQKLSDGTWNGMVGELMRNEADLAVAPLTITAERESVIDMSKPYMTVSLSALYKPPEAGSKLPFTNIDELIGTDYKYFPIKGGSTEAFFEKARFKLFRQMSEQMKTYENEFPATTEEGVKMVRENDHYVLIGESTILEHWVNTEPCNLALQKLGVHRGYGIGFPHASPLVREFSKEILKMGEDGSLHLLKDKWWQKECPRSPKICVCEDDVSSEENDLKSEEYMET